MKREHSTGLPRSPDLLWGRRSSHEISQRSGVLKESSFCRLQRWNKSPMTWWEDILETCRTLWSQEDEEWLFFCLIEEIILICRYSRPRGELWMAPTWNTAYEMFCLPHVGRLRDQPLTLPQPRKHPPQQEQLRGRPRTMLGERLNSPGLIYSPSSPSTSSHCFPGFQK